MRLAVISDIHSNILALKLALKDALNEQVDGFIFLGDYITDGDYANEILEVIKNLSKEVIVGNREKYILNINPLKREYKNVKALAFTYDELNQENKEYLKNLPIYKILNINNQKILIIHGDGYLSRNVLNDTFDKLIKEFDFDICLFGHSHKYLYKNYQGKIFINPGSIGQPTDSNTYKYCIIDFNNTINVNLREFKVMDTFNTLQAEYKKTLFYQNNFIWGNLVLNEIKYSKDICSEFMSTVRSKVKYDTSNNFNAVFEEVYNNYFTDELLAKRLIDKEVR